MDPGQLTTSFRAFCADPANAKLVEGAMLDEARQRVCGAERRQLLAFADQVETAGVEVSQALEPYMRHPVLKRLVCCLANDSERDLTEWALNQEVQAMLQRALQLPSKELEHLLLAVLKAPAHAAAFTEKTSTVAVLPPEQLAAALNEALAERRAGRELSSVGRHQDAVVACQRALSILTVIRGTSPAEQEEVERNKGPALLQLASALAAAGQDNSAGVIQKCTEALALPLAQEEQAEAHLIRAKANIQRSQWQAAADDLKSAAALGAVQEAAALKQALQREKDATQQKQASVYKRMFK